MSNFSKKIRSSIFWFIHTPAGLVFSICFRIYLEVRSGLTRFYKKLRAIFRSREFVNFTYHLNDRSRAVLPHLIVQLVGCTFQDAEDIITEIEADTSLATFYTREIRRSRRRWGADEEFKPGRNLLLYALVRLTKPRCVFEAGLDKGFGTIIINRALQRNRDEGYDVSYVGAEFRADRPVFLAHARDDLIGQIVYDSWSNVMERMALKSVDFFFYDAVANQSHFNQIVGLSDRLSPNAIIVSMWAPKELIESATRMGRTATVFLAEPRDHWFDGADLCIIHPNMQTRVAFQTLKN